MTVAELWPHYQAVKATLDAIPNLPLYEGKVEPAPPIGSNKLVKAYAVLFMGAGRPVAVNFCRDFSHLDLRWQVTIAGGEEQQVVNARDWVVSAFAGARLVVAGRASSKVRLLEERLIDLDRDVHPPRFFVPLPFGARTSPS